MMIERCPVCGSACRTAGVERLEDVAGLDHVKRALEVAAVGHHTVVLEALGNPRDASRLSEVAVALNVFTIVPLACPCGGYGSMAAQCICTVERLRAFRRRGLWRRAVQYGELFVEVREVPYEQISSTRPREAQARVLERIAAAQARPEMPTELVGASARLMQAAHRQLDFDAVT